MATVASFSAAPNPVPAPGRTTRLTVTFNLDPGTADQNYTAQLLDPAGAGAGSVAVTIKGIPAEAVPVVKAGATPGSWSISVPSGTLTPVAGQQNQFDWTV